MRPFNLDRAVIFGILARVWRFAAGPVTVLLIASQFSPELQGYYYTFNNLVALQVFLELGLGTVIIQFASHEWARLRLDKDGGIVGDADALSRLASLAQTALRWYAVAAVLAAVGLGLGGWLFFSRQTSTSVRWLGPWLSLCAFTGLQLLLVPLWALLEGCNQVAQLYAYRLVQAILSSLSLWLALLLGARLWVGSAAALITLIWAGLFLGWRYRPFLHSLRSPIRGRRLRWRSDIWPLQWRIASSWVSGYLLFSLFTPLLFHYRGPRVAGQMGMTWSLIDTLSAIAFVFVSTKVPRFGVLIAGREYRKLDHLFFQSLWRVVAVAGLGAVGIWVTVYGLHSVRHPLADRLLSPLPTMIFLLATVLNQITFAMAVYLRAHKREPYLAILAGGALIGAPLTLMTARRYGPVGVAGSFLTISAGIFIPALIVFVRRRTEWHSRPVEATGQ